MANVLFTRTSTPDSIEKIDGQLIFDTSGNGKMYLDNGTTRMEMGGAMTVDSTLSKTSTNPIQNRGVAGVMLDNLNDINNVTSTGFLADAMAVKELNGKLPSLDSAATMVIGTGDDTMTFKLKRTQSGEDRYTAFLVLCNQITIFIGAYAIGVNNIEDKITKIVGSTNASISRSGDNVTITFETNGIWSTGLLIAPREYAK